jgi:hypothetical protein
MEAFMRIFLLPIFSLIAFAGSAHAQKYVCEGTKYSARGQVVLYLTKNTASVSGTFNWDDRASEDLQKVDCTAKLENDGQSRVKKHDYYETKRNRACAFSYIRTQKDMYKRENGWIDLAIRGANDHDSSGYQYANFRCQ